MRPLSAACSLGRAVYRGIIYATSCLGISGFILRRSSLAWALLRAARKTRLWFSHRQYKTENQLASARIGGLASIGIVRLSTGPLLLAVAVAFTLTLPQPWLNEQLARVAIHSAWEDKPTDGTYESALTTVAAAAAGLLALFFATVGVIVSTSYVRATTDVRLLIFNEVLNRRYLRLNAHLATVATLGLVLYEFQGVASTALLVYVGIVATICLVGFFPVGIRVFGLFDPSKLIREPIGRIAREISRVRAGHRRSGDPSFQNHARSTAVRQLRVIHDLARLALDEERTTNSSVLSLGGAIHRLARRYASLQQAIPSESRWFPRRPHYANWQASDSSQTQVALATGTMQQPASKPYRGFIHDDLRRITSDTLEALLKGGDAPDAATLLLEVSRTATTLASAQDQAEALALTQATQDVVVEWLLNSELTNLPTEAAVSVVDVQCVASLAPILDCSKSLCAVEPQAWVAVEHQLRDPTGVRLYEAGHPREVLIALERVHSQLRFDETSDPLARAETWYLRHVALLAYTAHLRCTVEGVIRAVDANFVVPARLLVEAEAWLPAAFWLLRSIEACAKAGDQVDKLEAAHSGLKPLCRFEVDWIQLDVPRTRLTEARDSVHVLLGSVVNHLSPSDAGEALPDITGDIRAKIGEHIVTSLAGPDPLDLGSFTKLYLAYHQATFAVVLKLLLTTLPQGEAVLATDALRDLLELSGVALLYSELDQTDYGQIVKNTWDADIAKLSDKTAFIKLLYDTIDSRLSGPIFGAGPMQRQHWIQLFVGSLAERGVDVLAYETFHFGGKTHTTHSSDAIESIRTSHQLMFTEPSDYFAALYLTGIEPAEDLNPPATVQECIDSMRRAAERRPEDEEATDA